MAAQRPQGLEDHPGTATEEAKAGGIAADIAPTKKPSASTATIDEATAAAAPIGLCRCRGGAYENRRRANKIDEEQCHRCQAARQDVVAFNHLDLPVTSKAPGFGMPISLRRASRLSVRVR